MDRAKRTRPSRHAGQEVAETSSICVTFFLLSSASPHGVTNSVQYGTCTESECQTWFPARPSASDAGPIPYDHPCRARPRPLLLCAAISDMVLRKSKMRLFPRVMLSSSPEHDALRGYATYRSQRWERYECEALLHRGWGAVVARATTALLKLDASKHLSSANFSPRATFTGLSAGRRQLK